MMERSHGEDYFLNEDSSIILYCPSCAAETPHRILKGRFPRAGGTFTATVSCEQCGFTHQEEITIPKDVTLRLNVSFEERTERGEVVFPEDEILRVGEEIYQGEHTLLIKALELKDGRRVKRAQASEIMTVWAVNYDKVPVKVSINRGARTTSHKIYAHPDEDFYIGDIITVGRVRAVIDHIKTERRVVHRGSVPAREIVRVYCKIIKERHFQ
ncbi:MAG: hypothetical protein J7L88_04175 [Thermoplasmata archaeon]|nr:hypothetical protein [Thermoplasmata archaeon]